MRLPPPPPRPDLDALVKAALKHELTPGELWDQKLSFVYGNLPKGIITPKAHVKARMIALYGPRPEK